MPQLRGRDIFHWFVLFTFLAGAILLVSCGSTTHSNENPLQVTLQIPQGEDPQFFWFGVQDRVLRVEPKRGEPHAIAWEAGKTSNVDLREDDKVIFLGTDSGGRLLVTGEITVKESEEKKVTIPLRRVL